MPAFSLGKQKKLPTFIKKNHNPGVGSYHSDRRSFDSTVVKSPSFVIGKTKKMKTQKSAVPASNTYHIQKNSCFEDKNRGFHMIGKRKQRIQSQGPGPAHYKIEPNTKTKLYSFGSKPLKNLRQILPGPTSYSPDEKHKSMAISFEKSKRPSFEKEKQKNPGPGDYESSGDLKMTKNSFSFAKKQKFNEDKVERKIKEYPGQFNYNLSNINVIKKKSIASKFGNARRKSLLQEQSSYPSPAQYNIKNTERKSPNAVIGTSSRSLEKNTEQPGPAKYSIANINKIYKQEPSVKFGTSPRSSNDKNKNPGVGAYNIDFKETKKSWTMSGKKISSPRQNKSPGPQDYDPHFKNILKKSEMAIIGGQKRDKMFQEQNPGPGEYNIADVNKKSKTFFFNKEVKRESNENVPGPGTYNLKRIIGSDVRQEE